MTDVTVDSDGNMTLTGSGITAYRFLQLRGAMEMELIHKLYNNFNPFDIFAREFEIDCERDDEDRIINKEEILSYAQSLSVAEAVAKMESYAIRKKDEPKKKPEKRRGTRDTSETFEVVDGYFTISLDLLCNILCTAFEGGSNYWYFITDYREPSDPSMIPTSNGIVDWAEPSYVACCWGDGAVIIVDKEEYYNNDRSTKGLTTYELTEEKIVKGLELFARQFKKRWVRICEEEDYDGEDADLFLQLCLFEEVVYG